MVKIRQMNDRGDDNALSYQPLHYGLPLKGKAPTYKTYYIEGWLAGDLPWSPFNLRGDPAYIIGQTPWSGVKPLAMPSASSTMLSRTEGSSASLSASDTAKPNLPHPTLKRYDDHDYDEEDEIKRLRTLLGQVYIASDVSWNGKLIEYRGGLSSTVDTVSSPATSGSSESHHRKRGVLAVTEDEDIDDQLRADQRDVESKLLPLKTTKKSKVDGDRKIACFFYKLDPIRYRECGSFETKEIHRLYSDHLPKHKQPYGPLDEKSINDLKSRRKKGIEHTGPQWTEIRWRESYCQIKRMLNIPLEDKNDMPSCWHELQQGMVSGSLSGEVLIARMLQNARGAPGSSRSHILQLLEKHQALEQELTVEKDKLHEEARKKIGKIRRDAELREDEVNRDRRLEEKKVEKNFQERARRLLYEFAESVSAPSTQSNGAFDSEPRLLLKAVGGVNGQEFKREESISSGEIPDTSTRIPGASATTSSFRHTAEQENINGSQSLHTTDAGASGSDLLPHRNNITKADTRSPSDVMLSEELCHKEHTHCPCAASEFLCCYCCGSSFCVFDYNTPESAF